MNKRLRLKPEALADLYEALAAMTALFEGYTADEGASPDAKKIEKEALAALRKARGE